MKTLFYILVFLFSLNAFCCTCTPKWSVKKSFKHSEVIVSVRVLEILNPITPNDTTYAEDGRRIIRSAVFGYAKKVEILEVYKGKNIKKIMIIQGEETNCEFRLQKGSEYLVYGRMNEEEIQIYNCGRTALREGNPDFEYLSKRKKKFNFS